MIKSTEKSVPVVSVIMPAYCAEKYIRQAVDSVLAQQVPLEVIVVDDASADGTREVLQTYENLPNFRYLRNEYNQGAAESRNRGVREARGAYIAYLDADDWWDKRKLAEQLELLEKTGAVMCSTGRELMKPDGTSMGKTISVKDRVTYQELLKHNSINCSSVVMRREVALEFPMCYDQSHEDYITWLKVLKKYGWCAGLNRPYLKCRLSEGGKSRNKLKSARMTFQVYRYMGYSLGRSCLYFVSYAVHGVLKYL